MAHDYILAEGALAIILFVLIVLRTLRTAIGGIGSISMTLEVRCDVGHGTLGPIPGAVETSGVTIDVLKLNDTEHLRRADERDIFLTVSGVGAGHHTPGHRPSGELERDLSTASLT